MYSETQWPRFVSWVLPPTVATVVILFFSLFAHSARSGLQFVPVYVAIAVVRGLGITKVRVDEHELRIYVYGLRVRTVPLNKIEEVYLCDLRPWRIGRSTGTSTYNSTGLRRGVGFRQIGKGIVRIGSRRPEELIAAITAHSDAEAS